MKARDKCLHPTIYLTIEAKSDKICVSVTINTAVAKPSPVNGSLNNADSLCIVEEHEAAETDCITVVHIDDLASNVEKQDPSNLSIAVVHIDDPSCSNELHLI
jgi:hypothetical protein